MFVVTLNFVQRCGVQAYYRYPDDVLLVASDRQGTNTLVRKFGDAAQHFKLHVEKASSSEMQYLDLWVDRSNGRGTKQPRYKSSSVAIPLSLRSCFPLAETADPHFIDRFSRLNFPQAFFRHILQISVQDGICQHPKRRMDHQDTFWISFPYSPVWHSAVQCLLLKTIADPAVQSLL